MPARPTRLTKPAADRRCVACKQPLRDLSLDLVLERLRDLLDRMQPRPYDAAETVGQRLERRAEWDIGQLTDARAILALLVDDADGHCFTCSPRMAALDAAYAPKK